MIRFATTSVTPAATAAGVTTAAASAGMPTTASAPVIASAAVPTARMDVGAAAIVVVPPAPSAVDHHTAIKPRASAAVFNITAASAADAAGRN